MKREMTLSVEDNAGKSYGTIYVWLSGHDWHARGYWYTSEDLGSLLDGIAHQLDSGNAILKDNAIKLV